MKQEGTAARNKMSFFLSCFSLPNNTSTGFYRIIVALRSLYRQINGQRQAISYLLLD
jgi:hypothetical protein